MRVLRCWVICLLVLGSSVPVWAHPGHGATPPDSVSHYVFEPVHVLPVLVLAAAIAVGLVWRGRRRSH